MLNKKQSVTHEKIVRFCFLTVFLCICVILSSCAYQEQQKSGQMDNDVDRPKITLQWRTESESDNYGFNVYRGETQEGPFAKINSETIRGAGTSGSPHMYTYTDFNVIRGKTYYYYLESVSFHGVKEKFSPVISQQVPEKKENEEN